MPDLIDAPEQAEAVVEQAAIETEAPSTPVNREEASAELTMARMMHAPADEISRLEALVHPPAAPAAEEKAAEAVETAPETKAEPETKEEPAGDTPQDEPEVKLSDRLRITHMSDKDRATANAINLLTRSGMDLAEATYRVMGDLSQAVPGTEDIAPVIEAVAPAVAAIQATIATAKARLGEIKAERSTLAENADLYGPDAVKLDNEQTDILSALAEATGKLTQAEIAQHQEQARNQQMDDAKQVLLGQVAAKWPDAVKPGTLHYMVAAQVASQVRGDASHKDHALSRKAEFVQYCAKEADRLIEEAKRLGKTPESVAPAAKAVQPPEIKAPRPASGSRASTPAPPEKSVADSRAESEAHTQAVLEGRATARRQTQRTFIAR